MHSRLEDSEYVGFMVLWMMRTLAVGQVA